MTNFTKLLTTYLSFAFCFFSSGVFGTFPVTGQTGPVRERKEIRELNINYPDQWNIFLLAFQALKEQSSSSQISYYGVASVHGVGPKPWDGVTGTGGGPGYCTHVSNLFCAWHRPYMVLFEMRLIAAAKAIAHKFPEATRAQYVGAANLLRLPFWDWAGHGIPNKPLFPLIFSENTVSVHTPTGQKTIINPLKTFHIPDRAIFSPYWSNYPTTLRYPTSEASTATSQENLAEQTFATHTAGQRNNVYSWFVNCRHYLETADDEDGHYIDPNCITNLESLHNNIHVWVGGITAPVGQMSIIPYGSFDPVFWFHHANVDRLYAMWEAIYPGARCPDRAATNATYTIHVGEVEGANSPLEPFHRNEARQFWTTSLVRKFTQFGYTYPDFAKGDSPAVIRARVNNLYGPNSSGVGKKVKRDSSIVGDLQMPNGSYAQYAASVVTPRYALGSTYNVFLFFDGPESQDVTTWASDPNNVGLVSVFGNPIIGRSGGALTRSAVQLSDPLADRLNSLSESTVVPFLKDHLKWIILGPDDNIVDPSTVPGFLLTVEATSIMLNEDPEDFPTYSAPIKLSAVTRGKAGGYQGVSAAN